MAMFQQYQGGIAPVQGISEAGARIGQFAQQGMQDFGKSLSEGINAYNENSAKSEMANVKIASLSQDIANKIAMYSKDPEIAQSGVLQGLMEKGKMLTEAPTKGLSQRLAIAHDAETSLAGFGQQLQEWSFLRGREIERGIAEGLKVYENSTTTTDPVFYSGKDPLLAVDPNQNIQQQKDRVMARFKQIRAANPNIKGSDEDFWAGWVNNAMQRFSKGVEGLHPAIVSNQLEALQAEKNIAENQRKVNALGETEISGLIMNKEGLYEEVAPVFTPAKDYESLTVSPAEKLDKDVEEAINLFAPPKEGTKVSTVEENLKERKFKELKPKIEQDKKVADFAIELVGGLKKKLDDAILGNKKITLDQLQKYIDNEENLKNPSRYFGNIYNTSFERFGMSLIPTPKHGIVINQKTNVGEKLLETARKAGVSSSFKVLTAEQINSIRENILSQEKETVSKANQATKKLESLTPENIKVGKTAERQPVPRVAIGDLVVGQTETTRPLTVSERKSQVSDFLTERFGAIDPTDPTGKKRIPVQGFDSFFQKAVPESEIKEFTTEGGIRLLHMNGKWEQIKEAAPKSLADIRKDMIGVYGQQTSDGRLVPTEFIPNSGIEIGGLYRGTDASEAQFNDEMVQLVDARRSIKKLQEINDSVGEFADLTKMGIAEVEVMNLKSALRKDIIGVGTVSNFEQSLIDKVIRNPTDFFSMESKDRAILLALAQRIDRRIQNIGAAKGLTVRIRDVNSANRYEGMRQQYLKAKGII